MNTEINYIDKTYTCDESGNFLSKEDSCCEDMNAEGDRSKAWYMLPILFDNIKLCKNENIDDIDYSDLVTMSLLTISYKKNCYEEAKNVDKGMFYNGEYTEKNYKLTVKIPEEKKYLCDIIAKAGSSAINKDLFNSYFKKLL